MVVFKNLCNREQKSFGNEGDLSDVLCKNVFSWWLIRKSLFQVIIWPIIWNITYFTEY